MINDWCVRHFFLFRVSYKVQKNGNGETAEKEEKETINAHIKKIRQFVTTALVRDKTILSGCAPPRASSDSLILHREHCFQHESSVPRTCPFRFTVPVRSIPESRYSSLWRCIRQSNDRPPPSLQSPSSVIADFRPCKLMPRFLQYVNE